MRSAVASVVSCTIVLLVACAGSNPAPVQPYSSEEPQPDLSSSAQAPAPAVSSAVVAAPIEDKRAEDCDKLAKAINANGDAFKQGMAKASDPKAPKGAWSELASTVEQAGGKVKELELKDKKLASWAQEYGGLMTGLAALLRQTDADFKKKDKAALKTDVGEIGKVEAKEAELTGRINGYCN